MTLHSQHSHQDVLYDIANRGDSPVVDAVKADFFSDVANRDSGVGLQGHGVSDGHDEGVEPVILALGYQHCIYDRVSRTFAYKRFFLWTWL